MMVRDHHKTRAYESEEQEARYEEKAKFHVEAPIVENHFSYCVHT